ncbi:MAG: SGNH/GDSL hydrolase family protein [Nitrospira sp.]
MVTGGSRIKRLSFYLVMVLISVLVLEGGFRAVLAFRVGPSVLFYGTPFHRHAMPGPTTNHTVMQHGSHQPGYTKFFPNEVKGDHDPVTNEIFRVSINSRGFRGGEFTEHKQPGVTRIVTLGASSTFGYYDRDQETYPYYLEQILNADSETTEQFEVINLAIPHLHSEEILALFEAEALPLHPDVVTLYEGVNDAARGNPALQQGDGNKTLYSQPQSQPSLVKVA